MDERREVITITYELLANLFGKIRGNQHLRVDDVRVRPRTRQLDITVRNHGSKWTEGAEMPNINITAEDLLKITLTKEITDE